MTNEGRLPLTFSLTNVAPDYAGALALAEAAETAGFTSMSFADRPHDPILEGWTLASAVAARTEKIRVYHMTLNIPYRFPAVLAKEAATLDLISKGRLDLCLGAGGEGNRPLYDTIGVPLAGPGERLQDLRDCIAILRGLWANEKFSFQGRVYHVEGAAGRPEPVQKPIPIFVGALQPRSLRLAGEIADGMVKNQGWTDAATMRDLNRQVDTAALKAGRTPQQIRRIINGTAYLAKDAEDAEDFRQRTGGGYVPGGSPAVGGLIGPASEVLALIRSYREAGVDTFNLRFPPQDAVEQVRRFAQEVMPETRSL